MNDVRALRVFGIEILLDPVLVVLDQAVGCAQYNLTGTVVALQDDGLTWLIVIFKPHDDIDVWRAIFPLDVYENSLKTLSEIWKEGLDRLTSDVISDSKNIREFIEVATAGYCIYRSSYLQTKYNRLRNEYIDGKKENKAEILSTLDEEQTLAATMYDAVSKNSTIGFESANHYFFNKYSLAEKVVNIEYLKDFYK